MLLSKSIITSIYDIWQHSYKSRSAAHSPVLVLYATLGIAKEDKMNWNAVDLELE